MVEWRGAKSAEQAVGDKLDVLHHQPAVHSDEVDG